MKKASEATYTNTVVRNAPTRILLPARTVGRTKCRKMIAQMEAMGAVSNASEEIYSIIVANDAKAKTRPSLFGHFGKKLS
jgi:hypothetical protein